MQALAKHKFARSSAQKTRLVADQIRGLAVGKALDVLTYSPKKAAELVKKGSFISHCERRTQRRCRYRHFKSENCVC